MISICMFTFEIVQLHFNNLVNVYTCNPSINCFSNMTELSSLKKLIFHWKRLYYNASLCIGLSDILSCLISSTSLYIFPFICSLPVLLIVSRCPVDCLSWISKRVSLAMLLAYLAILVVSLTTPLWGKKPIMDSYNGSQLFDIKAPYLYPIKYSRVCSN